MSWQDSMDGWHELQQKANGSPSPTSPLPSLPLPALTIQLLFAIFYYFLILRKYPKLPEDAQISREVVRFQERCVCEVLCECCAVPNRWENICLSCFCHASRTAHTMHTVGVMDFWPGVVLMTILPCCTLWLVHCLTELPEKLGAAPRGCFKECLCCLFCFSCVIAQDAIALDMIVGARTKICSVDTVS
ncbi:unnamed protein product [Prorocentrum cordatum]|uniref:Uncharacterized protein n=1 Tax=Prorocentrum cordatum TaxID=2364126 RepID=A0ABN9VN16_9DINO|nr:unnamed protein product [Polarella glacialis]